MRYNLQIFCILTLNHQVDRLYKLEITKDLQQSLVVFLWCSCWSIFMFAHWVEQAVDGLSDNFELGLEVCFLRHTAWVCKSNHHARPCQMLLRYLKKSLLHRLKGYIQMIYISRVYWKGVVRCKNHPVKNLTDIQ